MQAPRWRVGLIAEALASFGLPRNISTRRASEGSSCKAPRRRVGLIAEALASIRNCPATYQPDCASRGEFVQAPRRQRRVNSGGAGIIRLAPATYQPDAPARGVPCRPTRRRVGLISGGAGEGIRQCTRWQHYTNPTRQRGHSLNHSLAVAYQTDAPQRGHQPTIPVSILNSHRETVTDFSRGFARLAGDALEISRSSSLPASTSLPTRTTPVRRPRSFAVSSSTASPAARITPHPDPARFGERPRTTPTGQHSLQGVR